MEADEPVFDRMSHVAIPSEDLLRKVVGQSCQSSQAGENEHKQTLMEATRSMQVGTFVSEFGILASKDELFSRC
jgi:hypothetical protein